MEYSYYSNQIPIDIDNGEFVSLERNNPVKFYNVGFQAAKSIPEIPAWFLKKYIPSGSEYKILEPFAGSGTTILEGIKNRNSVYWTDNNPLSRLICRCKSCSVSPQEIEQALIIILSYVKEQVDVVVSMKFANIDLWFQKPVQEALTLIKEGIAKIDNENIKNALNLALSITVRKMSEMEDSMILAARRSNNRDFIEYSRNDVYQNFSFNVQKIIEAYNEWNDILAKGGQGIYLETDDARIIPQKNFFDAIVTSPPYINAMDYIWATKFELHWLDLVDDDKNRLEISSGEIGTERIPAKEYKELAHTENEELNKILADIYNGVKYKASKGQNELRSRVTYKYFVDMKRHFEVAYEALKTTGKYCFIIGDKSTICGVEIPVANMLRDIACEVGFKEVFRFNLLLKNRRLNIPRASFAGTIKYDTIIILEK